jgi:DnaJ like chaperone protein
MIELMPQDRAGAVARLCATFALSDTGIADIERLLVSARRDGGELDGYAREIVAIFANDIATRTDLVDLLFDVGAAESAAAAVLAYLGQVAAKLEVPGSALERVAARHFDALPRDPYAVLELKPGASDEAVHAAWRKLAQEMHPDALAARGVAEPIARAAAPRFAAINAAYDSIRAARGMK